jgi:hypothetical protein
MNGKLTVLVKDNGDLYTAILVMNGSVSSADAFVDPLMQKMDSAGLF